MQAVASSISSRIGKTFFAFAFLAMAATIAFSQAATSASDLSGSVPVVTFLENPVAELRAVTVAPATTAPFGSETVPDRSEALVAACASAIETPRAKTAMTKMVFPMLLKMFQ